MNKLILCLIAVMVSTILCGCAPTLYNYKNFHNIDSQRMLQLQQADIDQSVRAVKPLENCIAKSAVIVIPDRKIRQILIYGKTFMTPKSVIDTLSESTFFVHNGLAESIIKRNIFEPMFTTSSH